MRWPGWWVLFFAETTASILATSREPLDVDGERTYRIAPLALPSMDGPLDIDRAMQSAAVELFVERAAMGGLRSRSPTTTCATSARSPASWMGCHWPSSWSPPRSRVWAWSSSNRASATICRSSFAAGVRPRRGIRRLRPCWIGAISCCPRPSRSCCDACRSSEVRSAWTPHAAWRAATGSRGRTCWSRS